MLFRQVGDFGFRAVNGGGLFLIGRDIRLHPVEVLDFIAQPGKFGLGLGEGTLEAGVRLGVELE